MPPGVSCVPIRMVDFEKIFKYDTSIFGAPCRRLLEKCINLPGSLGWVAVDGNGAVFGYTLVKQVICEAGESIGLSMAPLYADNDIMARALLKVAVEGSCFELSYSDGGSYGDHAL